MDYVQSLLIDNHDLFFLDPERQSALIFVPERGFLNVIHDFSWMNYDQIYTFLFHLKRGI